MDASFVMLIQLVRNVWLEKYGILQQELVRIDVHMDNIGILSQEPVNNAFLIA